MDKQTMGQHIMKYYSSIKKEQSTHTHNMDESQKHCVE